MYDRLQESMLNAKIGNNFPAVSIEVYDRARAPDNPAWPSTTQMAAAAVGLAFMIAIGLAFFLEYMDRSVRKPEDVEQELRMPLVGFVPSMPGGNGSNRGRVIVTDPTSGPAESYRKIRAKLFVYNKESHAKTFCITSTTAGEGKTTLACNLAIAFAQGGAKTLLVDGDMRNPSVQRTFQMEQAPGLGEYLSGEAQWAGVLKETDVPNLAVVTAGTSGSRSAELLESAKMKGLLDRVRGEYEIVVVDAPPVLGVADSTILSHISDATLLVIQASHNPKRLVKRAKMELEAADAHVVGAVLNRVRGHKGDYYYYHRYYPKKA